MSPEQTSDQRHQNPQTLLIATRNRGKLIEFRQILSGLPLYLRGLDEFPTVGEAEETGSTFAENAIIKARYYFKRTGLPTLADDSGLEVEALGGAPGVHSARYAGVGATDTEHFTKLLDALKQIDDTQRRARFVCVLALIETGAGRVHQFEGTCSGHIAHEPRGSHGFGYDPIFIPDGFTQTLGELPAETKNQISHRAKALEALKTFYFSRFGEG